MTNQTPSLPQAVLTDAEIDEAISKSFDALMDHIYEYGTTAEGATRLARKIGRAAESAILSRMGGEAVPAGWRDIATAPKDGWLVVAAEGGAIRIESARYVHHHINAAKVDGDSCYFTHWQPLPAAPTAPAQQAADVQGERHA